jgi:hypothetical protein
MKAKCFIALGIIFIYFSCAGGGKYFGMDDLDPNDLPKAQYIYIGDEVLLGAKIRSGGILGHFWFNVLIMNKGNYPIQLNWVYDNLFHSYGEKRYVCEKIGDIRSYPDILNPDSYISIGFNVESRFNDVINDIEELYFHLNDNDSTYTLVKNPKAKWE